MKRKTRRILYGSIAVAAVIGVLTFVFATQRSHRPEKHKTGRSILTVAATVETEPVKTDGDSADDPALWVHPSDPSQSLVIGTNKKQGLVVYDLTGKELQLLPDGQLNNVDSRDGFPLGATNVSIVTASNRSNDSIAIYRVNVENRKLENVAARQIKTIDAYGSCMYRSARSRKFYYFVTNKQGIIEQYELFDSGGRVDARQVRRFNVGTKVEGCVADDELGYLYVGEEDVGIWKYQAEPDGGTERTKVDGVGSASNLEADVEGLTLAYEKDGKGYLIASSQGNNTFVVYQREGANAYVKSFRIVDGNNIDAVSQTDGIHVTTSPLGPQFPHGVFIAQDGKNDNGKQNFKLVPWQLIVDN